MLKSRAIKSLSVLLCLIIALSAFVTASAQTVTAETPRSADETQLLWSQRIGTNYKNAPSVPTVSGDSLIIMSKRQLLKLDTATGETSASAEMTKRPGYGCVPALCADGKIFCPLEDGTVEAYDFATMQRLWSFSDELGGQPLSPIVYSDGCVYTGFWDDEETDGNFICLDAVSGELKWRYTSKGGFYWAEAAAIGGCIVVGSDNGSDEINMTSSVYCFDAKSGEVLDTLTVPGDCRSGITVIDGTNELVFTTKAGYFCKTSVTDGKFSTGRLLKLSGASTSTPTVYNGKAYIGVQSTGFSGNLQIIDVAAMSVTSTLTMNGYPQSEMALTTAYEAQTGNVYVYATYNSPPGGVSVITVSADGTASRAELFAPSGEAAEYALSSIAVSEDGKLFYKNDSGTVFALSYKEPDPEPDPEPQPSIFAKIGAFFKSVFTNIANFFKGIFEAIFG